MIVSLFTRPLDWITRGLWRPRVSAEHLRFQKLNEGWNAEPNAPEPKVRVSGDHVLLEFAVNPHMFVIFDEDEIGILRFLGCSR